MRLDAIPPSRQNLPAALAQTGTPVNVAAGTPTRDAAQKLLDAPVRAAYLGVALNETPATPGVAVWWLRGSRSGCPWERYVTTQLGETIPVDISEISSFRADIVQWSWSVSGQAIVGWGEGAADPARQKLYSYLQIYVGALGGTVFSVPPGARRMLIVSGGLSWTWATYDASNTLATVAAAKAPGTEDDVAAPLFQVASETVVVNWLVEL